MVTFKASSLKADSVCTIGIYVHSCDGRCGGLSGPTTVWCDGHVRMALFPRFSTSLRHRITDHGHPLSLLHCLLSRHTPGQKGCVASVCVQVVVGTHTQRHSYSSVWDHTATSTHLSCGFVTIPSPLPCLTHRLPCTEFKLLGFIEGTFSLGVCGGGAMMMLMGFEVSKPLDIGWLRVASSGATFVTPVPSLWSHEVQLPVAVA